MMFRTLFVSQFMVTMLQRMTTAYHRVCLAFWLRQCLQYSTNSSGGKNLYWNFRFAPEGTSVQWSWGPHGKGRAEGGCLGKDLLDKLTGPVNQISKNTMLWILAPLEDLFPFKHVNLMNWIVAFTSHWKRGTKEMVPHWINEICCLAPWVVCTWGRHYWSGAATSPNYPNLCFHGWWGSKIQWHFGGVVLNISTNLAIVLRGRASGVSCGKSPWAWISHRAGCKRRWSF